MKFAWLRKSQCMNLIHFLQVLNIFTVAHHLDSKHSSVGVKFIDFVKRLFSRIKKCIFLYILASFGYALASLEHNLASLTQNDRLWEFL